MANAFPGGACLTLPVFFWRGVPPVLGLGLPLMHGSVSAFKFFLVSDVNKMHDGISRKNRRRVGVGFESLEERRLLASLPSGFIETQIGPRLDAAPVSILQTPDGRLLITTDDNDDIGTIQVIKNGSLLSQPALEIDIVSEGEMGILGMMLDPNFASNQHVYLYYTTNEDGAHNRLSRFTFNGDVIDPNSEVILMDFDRLGAGTVHNGGGMVFGNDGKIYIGIGENANPANSRSLENRLGKIIRINPDGSIPSDNPFYGSTTGLNRTIYALGVRNPFTMDIDKVTGRIFFNDVGPGNPEEINELVPGGDYGWPLKAGNNNDPSFEDPVYLYRHGDSTPQGCAVSGGRFYRPETATFPSEYRDNYFFMDYCGNWIEALDPETGESERFASDLAGGPVSLLVGNDGAIYYLTRETRTVRKIQYSVENPLTITQPPEPALVAVGEAAQFSVAASGQGTIGYQWQRRSGSGSFNDIPNATAATLNLLLTVASDNGNEFRVIVSSGSTQVASDPARLTVVNGSRPIPVITVPPTTEPYRGGDVITFSGSATDADETGSFSAQSLTWEVRFHHDAHNHPVLSPFSGTFSSSFTIPTSGETSANVWFKVLLTAVDATGLKTTVERDIYPATSVFTLSANLPGINLQLDGTPMPSPVDTLGVVGIDRAVTAPATVEVAGRTHRFVRWSNGSPRDHVITTPEDDREYVAIYDTPLVDNADLGYSEEGNGWANGPATGQQGTSTRISSDANAVATWTPILNAGTYEVRFFRVAGASHSDHAKVEVMSRGRTSSFNIDLSTGVSGWVSLGEFEVDGSGDEFVRLTNQGSGSLVADAVEFVDPAPVVVVDDAVTVFTLNEGAGLFGADTASTGAPDTAVLSGGASWTNAGHLNGAVAFDGVDDFLSIPDSTDINDRDVSKTTIAFWFNSQNVNANQRQLLYKQSGSNRGLSIYLDAGKLYVGAWSDKANWSGTFLNTASVQSGTWHHVALVLDADGGLKPDRLIGYLDGVAFGSGPGAMIEKHLGNISLGALDQGTRFHDGPSGGATSVSPLAGLIDEVRIYQRPLSPTEVSALTGSTPPPNDVITTLSINDVSQVETDSGTTNFVFTVSLDIPIAYDVYVTVNTSNLVGAQAGSDYIPMVNQPLLIRAGTTSKTLTVSVNGDTLVEPDETFSVTISSARFEEEPGSGDTPPDDTIDVELQIGDGVGVGRIINDDASTPPPPPPSIDDAVTVFTLNEGTGLFGADTASTGAPDTAVLSGGASWTNAGHLNGAVAFDGVDDFLSIPDSTDINNRDVSKTTIAFWFNSQNVNANQRQLLYKQSGSNRGLSIYLDAGKLYVGAWSDKANWSGTFLNTASVQSGTWHHVALVLDADGGLKPDRLIGYLDGVAFGSGPGAMIEKHLGNISLGALDQSTRFHDGPSGGATSVSPLAGLIDEVRIYQRPLSPTEVSALTGSTPPPNDVITTLSINDVSQVETDSGTTNFVFTVSLDIPIAYDVYVTVNTSDLVGAQAGSDYIPIVNQPLLIRAGTTSKTVTVLVNGDTLVEPDETFSVTISSARFEEEPGSGDTPPDDTIDVELQIGDGVGLGRIINDDASTPPPPPPSIDDAVTVFTLNEGTGPFGADTANSGTPDSANLIGATWTSQGYLDGGVAFDGIDDYLSIPDSADFNDGDVSKTTIAFWFKANDVDSTSRQLLFKQRGPNRGMNVYLDGGRLYVGAWSDKVGWSGTFLSTDGIESDRWHHAALVLNAQPVLSPDGLIGYLDGLPFAMGPAATIQKHLGNVSFGAADQGTRFHDSDTTDYTGILPFAGTIDEIRIYKRSLSPPEILSLAVPSQSIAEAENVLAPSDQQLRAASFMLQQTPTVSLHNESIKWDVNDDGNVSALDALQVINLLNQGGRFAHGENRNAPRPWFPDTSNDGRVTALDALLVINHLANASEIELAVAQIADDDDETDLVSLIDDAIGQLF